MNWINNWDLWLIAGFVLLILETLLPGIFLMWWGIAGIILGGIVVLFTIPLTWQFIFFAVLAVTASVLDWRYQRGKDRKQDQHSHLNQRDKAMLGQQGRVVDILQNGAIRAQFGDTTWKVEGQNLNIGDVVQVREVQGIVLLVDKIQ